MVDFRRWILALTVLALFAGLASAQTGSNQLVCGSNVSVTPTLRAEGFTEQTGDITLSCTGGSALAPGTILPTVNITIFFNTQVTSRLFSTGPNISEALLMIDEPGSPVTPIATGFGPQAPQKVCAFPLVGASLPAGTGCQQFASNVAAIGGVSAGFPGGLVTVATDAPGGTTAGTNVYQGVVNGSSVTWFGVPVLAPVTTGVSRVYRFTNIRVNATTLGGGAASGANPVQASISISGATSLLLTNPTQTVGFVQPGLTASSSSTTNLQQCRAATKAAINTLSFTEGFGTAFKTRVTAQTNTTYAGQGVPGGFGSGTNQNVPGSIYNSESNFVLPVPSGGTAGLADFGTRLKATFTNVPVGTHIFVSVANVLNNVTPGPAPAVIGGNLGNNQVYAQLVLTETGTDGNGTTGFFPSVAATDNSTGLLGIAEVTLVNGTGTAVWEVVNTNPFAIETLKFGVYTTFAANAPPGTGNAATVNLSFAPTPPAFTATTGSQASNTLPIPRFADTSTAKSVLSINICRTILLYPYVTNAPGFDTGLAIANTSTDPFGTGPQHGTCDLNWYSGATSPAKITTPDIPTATVYSFVVSSTAGLSGFTGYMIAVCQFQYAHGFAFISDLAVRNFAMGYLALVIGDPSSQANTTRNASSPGCGTGDIPCGAGEGIAH
jgi:hypothetical protein